VRAQARRLLHSFCLPRILQAAGSGGWIANTMRGEGRLCADEGCVRRSCRHVQDRDSEPNAKPHGLEAGPWANMACRRAEEQASRRAGGETSAAGPIGRHLCPLDDALAKHTASDTDPRPSLGLSHRTGSTTSHHATSAARLRPSSPIANTDPCDAQSKFSGCRYSRLLVQRGGW